MKVVILCGGKGLRLGNITQQIPKPLVYLKDKPLIEYITDDLYKKDFKDLILAIGYKGGMIKTFYEQNKKKGISITFVDSGDVDIIHRIVDSAKYCDNEFLVVYGDTIADVNIDELIRFHKKNGGLVTITTYPMQSPFGLVYSDNNNLVNSFKEKPFLDHWMNIGFMIFKKDVLKYIDKEDDLINFFQKLIKDKQLFEFKHKGKHITVNTEKEKKKAKKELESFYTY